MIDRLAAWLDLRPGERRLTLMLAAQYLLLLLAYYFLKPARDALFLTGAGVAVLPAAFVVSALVAAPVAGLYTRLGSRLSAPSLAAVTLLALGAQLPLLRWLLAYPATWVYYVLYAWVGVFGILTTSQFWLLAGEVLDAAQSRRIFPVLGVAGIAGAFAGGQLTQLATGRWGLRTEDLLLAGLATVAVASVLALVMWRTCRPSSAESRRRRGPDIDQGGLRRNARLVFRSRLLALVVGLVAISILVTTVTDYQFKAVTAAAVTDDRELASFLGSFYSLTSLASLLLQLVLAGRILRWFGTVGALTILPSVLTLGTIGLLAAPGLATAVFLRGSDLAAKYSIQQTAREMLYLPVPSELKRRTKIIIDVLADRIVRGAGGLLLLGLTLGLGVSVRQLSLVTLVLLAVWAVVLVALRREYVGAFRQALARRQIDPYALRRGAAGDDAVKAILTALDSGNERQIAYALELLPNLDAADLAPRVQTLLTHAAPSVRRRALSVLVELDSDGVMPAARAALDDADLEVRAAAIGILMADARENPAARLRRLLAEGELPRNAALIWLSRADADDLIGHLDPAELSGILDETGPQAVEGRRALAYALRRISRPECRDLLEKLSNDREATVARAAIRSLGAGRDMLRLPWLLERLADRELRPAVREALVSYGRDGLLALRDGLTAAERPLIVRIHLARSLGAIPDPEALESLLAAAPLTQGVLRQEVLRQAVRLRLTGIKLPVDRLQVRDLIDEEAVRCYGYFQVQQVLARETRDDSGDLLRLALGERRHGGVENLFALLAMLHHPRGMQDAGARVRAGDARQRGQAIVYLEQILDQALQDRILPLVDGRPESAVWSVGRDLYGLALGNAASALRYLAASHDDWLRACTAYHLRRMRPDGGESLLDRAARDPVPMVREAAGARERMR